MRSRPCGFQDGRWHRTGRESTRHSRIWLRQAPDGRALNAHTPAHGVRARACTSSTPLRENTALFGFRIEGQKLSPIPRTRNLLEGAPQVTPGMPVAPWAWPVPGKLRAAHMEDRRLKGGCQTVSCTMGRGGDGQHVVAGEGVARGSRLLWVAVGVATQNSRSPCAEQRRDKPQMRRRPNGATRRRPVAEKPAMGTPPVGHGRGPARDQGRSASSQRPRFDQ